MSGLLPGLSGLPGGVSGRFPGLSGLLIVKDFLNDVQNCGWPLKKQPSFITFYSYIFSGIPEFGLCLHHRMLLSTNKFRYSEQNIRRQRGRSVGEQTQ